MVSSDGGLYSAGLATTNPRDPDENLVRDRYSRCEPSNLNIYLGLGLACLALYIDSEFTLKHAGNKDYFCVCDVIIKFHFLG